MTIRRLAGLTMAAALLLACGSSTNATGGGGGGEGGEGGTAGGGGEAGAPQGGGGAAPDHAPDNAALAACAGPSSCAVGTAQTIEGGNPSTIRDMECVVTALRDRTSGLYHVELDETHAQGSETSTFTFFITPGGEIELGELYEFAGDGSETTWHPTQRCAPQPVSFFESCLTALQAGDPAMATAEAWACVYPNVYEPPPWFDDCVAQAPTCE